ncbi:MAG: hypothetical protein WCJ84_03595 [Candidatus Peregrinibacteria bacterium]
MKRTLLELQAVQKIQRIDSLHLFLMESQSLFSDMPEVQTLLKNVECEILKRPELGSIALQARIGGAFSGDIASEEIETNISFLSGKFTVSDMIELSSERIQLFAHMLKSIIAKVNLNLFRIIKVIRIMAQEKRLIRKMSMFSLCKFQTRTKGITHQLLQFLWPSDVLHEKENAITAREIMAEIYYDQKTASPPFFAVS